MNDDEELCVCFHVNRRKVIQYIRVEKPTRVSQLSECFGAGTGCGWCRPFLKQLMEKEHPESVQLPDSETYQNQRRDYRDKVRNIKPRLGP
ncbi:Nitrite reductase [NAD(P)H] [Planctomycetes bacterium CA13]|uniref:Nitrite reductase [NAD(P)H] n=1 Tax=Novipirellula herctigrandis TaxID=2527986 RepID=A0A5C5YPG6_9BACT|nr:Nitrite reductase [NAD(P)H] [Planctomycetes bacterium CA13]